MGLEDFRKEIDQLAKLKMNVLQFYWGMGGPWAEFSYGGKEAEIIYPKESGYCAWAWNSGTAKTVKVGRECFPPDGYLGPPEFAKVQTQEEAYRTARDFLREVIRYAHQRKVQVWLAMGEITYVPPNLVPATTAKSLGFGPFYCGIAIPHGDPGRAGHLGGRRAKHDRDLSGGGPLLGLHGIGSAHRGRRPADPGADPRLRRSARGCSRRSLRPPWTPIWPTSPRPTKLVSPDQGPLSRRPSSERS